MLLLFDIDGVLNRADYFTVQYEKEFGIKAEVFDNFFINELSDILIGKSKLEEILPRYFESWKWKGNIEEFLNYWFRNDVNIDLELLEIINELKGKNVKLGIASQQEFRRKDYLLNHTSLKDKFDLNYFSCDIGYLKTAPEFYQKIINENQEEIYFWDDTIENIEVAHQNGINGILYTDINEFKIQLNEILKID